MPAALRSVAHQWYTAPVDPPLLHPSSYLLRRPLFASVVSRKAVTVENMEGPAEDFDVFANDEVILCKGAPSFVVWDMGALQEGCIVESERVGDCVRGRCV